MLQHVDPTRFEIRAVTLKVGYTRNADTLELAFGAQDFQEATRFRTRLTVSVEVQ